MDRREFVKISAGAVLAGAGGLDRGPLIGRALATEGRSLDRIGVQLYTVRHLLTEDFEGTLEAVARIGFHQVEFHDYFGRSPRDVRDLLDDLRLDAPAAHYPWHQLRQNPDRILETAREVGHRYVILAWMPPEERSSLDQYRGLAAFFNEMGEACKQAGMRFAFHNHDFEFLPIAGQVPFDLLLNETDPDLVDFELDLFWTLKGGRDPLDYFASHPGRFPLCHVKDMAADQTMVDVGVGEIDFASIFAKGDRGGLKYFFVEHDEPADPLASITTSFDYLVALRF